MKVQKCESLIEEWSHLFRRAEELVSFSSGQQSLENVQQDLLKARKIREKQLQEFIDNRILSYKVELYEPIKRLGLKISTSLEIKKKQPKSRKKKKTIKSSLKTFLRLIILQEKRNISIGEVLSRCC